MANPMYRQIAEDLRARSSRATRARGAAADRARTPGAVQRVAEHRPRRDQVAHQPRPGRDPAGPGHLRDRQIDPFVTTLTGDPEGGGDEAPVYLAEVKATSRTPTAASPSVEIQRRAARSPALRDRRGDEVVSRHQQRFIDDTPWSLQTSFYPMSWWSRAPTSSSRPSNIEEGTVDYLARTAASGRPDTVTPSRCGAERDRDGRSSSSRRRPGVGLRGLPDRLRPDGDAIRLTITVYPADRNQFASTSARYRHGSRIRKQLRAREHRNPLTQRTAGIQPTWNQEHRRASLYLRSRSTRLPWASLHEGPRNRAPALANPGFPGREPAAMRKTRRCHGQAHWAPVAAVPLRALRPTLKGTALPGHRDLRDGEPTGAIARCRRCSAWTPASADSENETYHEPRDGSGRRGNCSVRGFAGY